MYVCMYVHPLRTSRTYMKTPTWTVSARVCFLCESNAITSGPVTAGRHVTVERHVTIECNTMSSCAFGIRTI